MKPNPAYYSPAHEDFRQMLRRFVDKEIAPFVNDWDEAASFPRELYQEAAAVGLLGLGFPEQYGGAPDVDAFYHLIASEELARAGSGGVIASLMSHSIGAPPLMYAGSEALKRRILPDVIAGKKISALAITEPGGGSDVAALKTTAVLDGHEYVVNGEKTFITSGMRADYFTVAVRTNPDIRGAGGISLLLIERDRVGFSRIELKKMGWWASDTAQLHFNNCRVPAANLIGVEGQGFRTIMRNFNTERFGMAAGAYGFAKVCYEDALAWSRERQTFGQRLLEHQVVRHKLVEMATQISTTRALLEDTAYRMSEPEQQGNELVAQICMLKNVATRTMQFCADAAVQTLGGMGFMRGTRVERIYREVKVNMIGGGAEEIMKDLIARQLEY
ncbi:acyl-CoA dehydrogenase family protein [Undibacterium terreum]|uniref:Acyl-CoA dehydrogenase n=1 Tax=Undibacterium terreum TaxID=1224302 RepID=A0A916UG49_9BURK|nr:acyl-CoA dehydrogenase family protein [Undibacterium terreum]GGC69761.1 acyl-CoA dehydrogenase [Undibacterium terreum]